MLEGTLAETAVFLYKAAAPEERAGQMSMICNICDVVEKSFDRFGSTTGRREAAKGSAPLEICFGQAPVGTGKSMAIILSAMAAWLRYGANSVVATHTHVLQDQMLYKDFPAIKARVENILGPEALKKWKGTIVKGIGNHPCRARAERLRAAAASCRGRSVLVNNGDRVVVAMENRVAEIFDSIFSGKFSLPEDDPLFPLVSGDRNACDPHTCPHAARCPYYTSLRARVPFVVVNHSFLTSAIRGFGVSGTENETSPKVAGDEETMESADKTSPFMGGDVYFFDEAHHLVGYRALGRELVSVRSSEYMKLLDFASPGGDAELFGKELSARKRFGALCRKTLSSDSVAFPENDFSSLLEEWRRDVGKAPFVFRNESEAAIRTAAETCAKIRSFKNIERETINSGKTRKTVSEDGFSIRTDGEASMEQDARAALLSAKSMFFFSGTLFTSCETSPGAAFAAETGLVPTSTPFSVPSPFDFANVSVWIPAVAPLGTASFRKIGKNAAEREHTEFSSAFCRTYIPDYVEADLGGVLVLCSSKRRMNELADAVAKEFAARKMDEYLVMRQGIRSRRVLAKDFSRASSSCVLFGSASFREGFDVTGKRLTWVIVDRLPFPVPGSEESERTKKLKEWGYIENEFAHSVELMKFHLAQAAGRLVRTRDDWGTITLLDNRILTTGAEWGCESCLPVPKEKWFTDLPLEAKEWTERAWRLERNAVSARKAPQTSGGGAKRLAELVSSSESRT